MITYFDNNILCIEAGWLIKNSIISQGNYQKMVTRKNLRRLQYGGFGHPSLIEYDSIPYKYRQAITDLLGYDPKESGKHAAFRKFLVVDREAVTFFSNYQLQNGHPLPIDRQKEYHQNAMFLNALNTLKNRIELKRKNMGGNSVGVWDNLTDVINDLRDEYGHTLPGNAIRLHEKHKQYKDEGYTALIHRGYGNNNSRKVNAMIEKLILSIYVMDNKPYPNMVRDTYIEFLAGKIDIIDQETGELFKREEFFSDKGLPVVISEATIWNYVNNPKNRAIVDSQRNDFHYFNNIHRPHHHRALPQYSLSKISLDDRDLIGKILVGGKKQRVKAYYAYDVASGCLIGSAYSKTKDKELYLACMRDMFGFLSSHKLGFPIELEVEHHIVGKFSDDLMKAGNVFPMIRWCAPGNSQEKRAEHFNRAKKYGFEKRYNEGVGRFTLTEANRPKQINSWDDEGIHLKEKVYEFDELVANDRFTIQKYNNALHPDQKKFKGLTRIQVLLENVNPNVVTFKDHIVAQYAGEHTETSIRRNQYVRVNYADYQLPNVDIIGRLATNDYKVEAYYLTSSAGTVDKVHLFQDGQFICTCTQITKYNEATAEQTDDDRNAFTEQSKYVSSFDGMIKRGRTEKTSKIKVMRHEEYSDLKVEIHESVADSDPKDWDNYTPEDYAAKALREI